MTIILGLIVEASIIWVKKNVEKVDSLKDLAELFTKTCNNNYQADRALHMKK
jgi:hypothetical protein